MPPISTPFRVLVTGYGAFSGYKDNPSWLAVKPLNGLTLRHKKPSSPDDSDDSDDGDAKPKRPIHITSFEIPVAYSSVLSTVPPLHERPPRLPSNIETDSFKAKSKGSARDPALGVPKDGYDLIIHTGVGSPGGLSVEKMGRKVGYALPDANKEFAPVVVVVEDGNSKPKSEENVSASVQREKERVASTAEVDSKAPGSNKKSRGKPTAYDRGFGEGYGTFPQELWNPIDIDEVVKDVKASGFTAIESSIDAGLYLCEFINYCALAESQRSEFEPPSNESQGLKSKKTQVLFVHVPPIGNQLSTERTTDGLRRVIETICWKVLDETNAKL